MQACAIIDRSELLEILPKGRAPVELSRLLD